MLRIEAADSSTTASETQLTDDIFGAAGDLVNLKSQFSQCSYGQLQFEPISSNALVDSDGVYTVTLPNTNVIGADDAPIVQAAVDKATTELGTALTDIADHVIVCVPAGTKTNWIAYAYVNHWLSVFNNAWCGYPSGLMHEIGKLGSGICSSRYDCCIAPRLKLLSCECRTQPKFGTFLRGSL